jgi:type VI secretion system protein ImpK
VEFHNEAWGGEKVFQLLGKLIGNVGANRGLLELIYCAISLGFEGRYRVARNGRAELEGVREKLALKLREQSGSAHRELSPQWQGLPAEGRRLRDGLPVWVVATGAAVLLALTFVGLRFAMSDRTNPIFSELQRLDVRAPKTPVVLQVPAPQAAPAAVAPGAPPRLSTLLKPEIEAGLVEVRDLADRSIVTIKGDGFFEAGSAEVEPRVLPLLNRIAEELAKIEGQVLVTGHTDTQPIRSIRFPSNWHLSEERAKSVRTKLAPRLKPERIRSEGLADTQPIADNATPAGRARNRRVEVTLRMN